MAAAGRRARAAIAVAAQAVEEVPAGTASEEAASSKAAVVMETASLQREAGEEVVPAVEEEASLGHAASACNGAVSVGSKVLWNGKQGTVRYVGTVKFAAGEWVGVELNEDGGMHDGRVLGVAYFHCKPRCGIFAHPSALRVAGEAVAPAAPLAAPPASRPVAVAAPVVGSKVLWKEKEGVVRYVGATKFAAGEWVGVELDGDGGMHDGTVMGKSYFRCAPRHGIFAQANALTDLGLAEEAQDECDSKQEAATRTSLDSPSASVTSNSEREAASTEARSGEDPKEGNAPSARLVSSSGPKARAQQTQSTGDREELKAPSASATSSSGPKATAQQVQRTGDREEMKAPSASATSSAGPKAAAQRARSTEDRRETKAPSASVASSSQPKPATEQTLSGESVNRTGSRGKKKAGQRTGKAPGEPKAAEFELMALPWLPKPAYRAFVRNVPGDAGFDPLGLAGDSSESFLRMFDAELKHGRIAMLAFAGFAGAESLHEVLAEKLGLPDLIGENGCTPTFFNGGIFEPLLLSTLVPILILAAVLELDSPKNTSLPGYYGFDPLRFGDIKFSDLARSLLRSDVEWVAEAEMKHGRLAMLAVTWCFIQETITKEPIFPEI